MSRLTTGRKVRSLLLVTLGSFGVYTTISIYKDSQTFYRRYLMPLVHLLEPEKAHRLAILAAKYRLFPRYQFTDDDDALKIKLFGKEILNPIGLAAGFDKHGEAILGMHDIGFGFVEIGSVTPKPQFGNEKPRVFRLQMDEAIINRYGFNSDGHDVVYNRLQNLKMANDLNLIVGVNLGKNKESMDEIDDYINGIKKFGPIADYLVINVSSPNTPGLRNLQTKSKLQKLLSDAVRVRNEIANKPPLFLKLAPDLSADDRKDIADVLKQVECKIDGLIISNTTIDRPEYLLSRNKCETGGLSGTPLKDISTQMITDMYKLTDGMTIIGVGGVSSGRDAYEKIKAGASAIQLYTAFIYEGPPLVNKIKKELLDLLMLDNYKNISDAIGKGAFK